MRSRSILIRFKTMVVFFQAGGMQRAQQLPKIRDAEKESLFGYVYAVSGPGEIT